MACKVQMVVENYDKEGNKIQTLSEDLITIEQNEQISSDQIADLIAAMPLARRKVFAEQLSKATTQNLTNAMAKKHSFISNITVSGIINTGGFGEKYEGLLDTDIDDNCTLVYVNTPPKANGFDLRGKRVITKDGRETIFMCDKSDMQKCLDYLLARKNAVAVFDTDQTVPDEYADYIEDLDLIAKHFGTSRASVILNYLDNKDTFKLFKIGKKVINPSDVLYHITQLLAGEDPGASRLTQLETAVLGYSKSKNQKIDKKTMQTWTIKKSDLHRVLRMYIPQLKLSIDGLKAMTQDELQTLLVGKDGLFKGNPKLMNSKVWKSTEKEVVLYFPYTVLKDMGCGYNTVSLYSPVNEGEVVNGEYHGMYVYKASENGKETYAVSPNIINLDSAPYTGASLEWAMQKVDEVNNHKNIALNSLMTMKRVEGIPRRVTIEQENLHAGQTVSVLDIAGFPVDVDPLTQFHNLFRTLYTGTVEQFHEVLKDVPGIDKIYTPEQAAAFLVMAYKTLYNNRTVPKEDTRVIRDLVSYKDMQGKIIDPILNAGKRHYNIDKHIIRSKQTATNNYKYLNQSTVTYLHNNGTDLQIDGTSIGMDNEGNPLSVKGFMGQILEGAVDYFNTTYGTNIICMSKTDIQSSMDIPQVTNNIDTVRGFIYDGVTYINTSNAILEDVVQEASYIFLDIMRSSSPEAYTELMNWYMGIEKSGAYNNARKARFDRARNTVSKIYNGFSEIDIDSETVVRLIAEDLSDEKGLTIVTTENGGITGGFNTEVFERAMNDVLNHIKSLKGTVQDGDNGLGYMDWAKNLVQGQISGNKANNQKVVSIIIREQIKNKNITESC